jgi:hypothetical protein
LIRTKKAFSHFRTVQKSGVHHDYSPKYNKFAFEENSKVRWELENSDINEETELDVKRFPVTLPHSALPHKT